jgi:trans-2,3-dihydro-3-hydroxyanthranilate isomerase
VRRRARVGKRQQRCFTGFGFSCIWRTAPQQRKLPHGTEISLMQYHYRLLNVFALEGQRLSGNPLCVFENAQGLSTELMQALALQFNLSETTFIQPSTAATARVRIFTPDFEMPFAGHPTLGTSQVVRDLFRTGDAITLEMKAGIIPVNAQGDEWTLQANAPSTRAPGASREQLAAMLGLPATAIGAQPLWVNTGSEQLVIPLSSADAVAQVQPDLALMERFGSNAQERRLAYVWAETPQGIVARFFFGRGPAIAEDPATGSAAANLGGWFVATRAALPLERVISQGDRVGRPSALRLKVSAERNIFVAGRVIELGRGVIEL